MKRKIAYTAFNNKSFDEALTRLFKSEFGFLGGPAVIRLIVDRIKELCEEYFPPHERFRTGQILWVAIDKDTRKGPSVGRDVKYVPVVLDLVTKEDLEGYIKGRPINEIRKRCIARLFKQAYAQDGVLSQLDIAVLIHCSMSFISNLTREYEEEAKEVLPTRGVIHDIGPTLTHKRIIVSEYFRGKLAPEIARECNHSIEACDRYITNAEQVKAALDHGIPKEEIPFVTGLSRRLTKEYLDLIQEVRQSAIKE